MVETTCKKCGESFMLGVNGTIHGCDKCTGVERIADIGSNASAWFPGEDFHLYGDSIETAVRVTREQARAASGAEVPAKKYKER